MALKLVIPPTELPVTLAEAKAHLRVDTNDEDALIAFLIQSATQHFDGKDGLLNRALKPQLYELTFDVFPSSEIAIPIRPLISVDSINYDDTDGIVRPVSDGDYFVDYQSDPAWIVPAEGFVWPDTFAAVNAVRVLFTAGYLDGSGDQTTVPAPIRNAILETVHDKYEHRGSVSEDGYAAIPVPATALALVHSYLVFL